jgi:hypothetical protein
MRIFITGMWKRTQNRSEHSAQHVLSTIPTQLLRISTSHSRSQQNVARACFCLLRSRGLNSLRNKSECMIQQRIFIDEFFVRFKIHRSAFGGSDINTHKNKFPPSHAHRDLSKIRGSWGQFVTKNNPTGLR